MFSRTFLQFSVVALLVSAPCPAAAENVLHGLLPRTDVGSEGRRITDDVLAPDGTEWRAQESFVLEPGAALEWQLAGSELVEDILIQADNNDEYRVSGSRDGISWMPIWTANSAPKPGLFTRRVTGLSVRVRFLRLEATGGDGRYSVSEFQAGRLGTLTMLAGASPIDAMWAAVVLACSLLLVYGGANRRKAIFVSICTIGLACLTMYIVDTSAARIDWLRAVAATLAFVAIAWNWSRSVKHALDHMHVRAVLVAAAVLATLCFLNFARPQFGNSYLHHYDMRTYFLMAKFMPELKFDGLYVASTIAVEENSSRSAFAGQPLRDLRTHEMTQFGLVRDHGSIVRSRFTDARWLSFRTDVGYFRSSMGDPAFLDSMKDHGGNATPVWFMAAWLLFALVPASDLVLWLGTIVDMALLAFAFWLLWRAFGPTTAVVALTLFGSVDFYQFGTNWFGSTLRHDWLALWCVSLAALKLGRPTLAGALMAWSALIRAFPALGIMAIMAPVALDMLATMRSPSLAKLKHCANRHHLGFRFLAGVVAASAVLLASSVALFGFDIWLEWWHKVSLLNAQDHINNIALRTWITGIGKGHLVIAASITLGVMALTRRMPPASACALGVLLVPIVFSPANYYLHAVFLLAVCGAESEVKTRAEGAVVQLLLLAMCVASYFTRSADVPTHFRNDTIVLFTTLAGFVAVKVWGSSRAKVPEQEPAITST